MSDQEMRLLFNQLDLNSDGEINYDEFLGGVNDKRLSNSKAGRLLQSEIGVTSRENQDTLLKLFRQLDTDNSNTINFAEMKIAFAGANMPDSELRQLFNQLDSN